MPSIDFFTGLPLSNFAENGNREEKFNSLIFLYKGKKYSMNGNKKIFFLIPISLYCNGSHKVDLKEVWMKLLMHLS